MATVNLDGQSLIDSYCAYIYTHVCNCIYVCIGYILYTLYLPTQTVKCVLSIYAYLHIISSNGRPKYNIMYVCIYYIIVYCTYVLNYTRQHADVCVFTCTHSFTLWVLHCWHHITLHDITWHHMTLRYITYTLHACMYILLYIYIHKYMHLMNYTQQHLVACCQWLPSANRAPTFSVGGLEPVRDSSQNCLTL